jgi:prepilin-type N-terminal cleavage/methylation domain-containing protein
MRRCQTGFTFIEILVVMGILVTLMGMVAVVVPHVQEQARRAQCTHHVRQLANLYAARATGRPAWPLFDGKRFVLAAVASGWVDATNPQNLEVFFCPGDVIHTLEEADLAVYRGLTPAGLAAIDPRPLTSYAGRRNQDPDHRVTAARLKAGAPLFCDDDDGALHHTDGLVVGYANGQARFVTYAELGMAPPEDENDPRPFLGDAATAPALQGLASD